MDQIHHIRQLYFEQGMNLTEIEAATGFNWKTVKKYVDMEDFSQAPPKPKSEGKYDSKLDVFKPLIDSWLEADKKAPRKQRHTARQVFKRLSKEAKGFNSSYRLVATYVAEKKKQLNLRKPEGYIPLIHHPGEGQADFGQAQFFENGKEHIGKYLVLSFPYSNAGFLQLNYGENMECLLEGLVAIFEYIGGVPAEIWFDNTRTIVTKIIKGGGRNLTERFKRFQEHYRFRAVFMNPEAGWEKGNVECKVGYHRRNLLVPPPRFIKLTDKNAILLQECAEDHDREHYDKDRFISELFEEDKQALLPLPTASFDTAHYTSASTNKYGKFTLNDGKHEYSASPAFSEVQINLKITSSLVIVLDASMHEITRHKRLYGEEHQKSMDWLPYLKYIARKPRSLRNSGIYDMMPENMQHFMDTCQNSDRGQILKALSELTDRTGFDSAIQTVNQAIMYQITDSDSLKNLYRQLYNDVPEIPPLQPQEGIPNMKVININTRLSDYDALLVKRRGCK